MSDQVVVDRAATRTTLRTYKPKTQWGTHIALIFVCLLVSLPALYALLVSTMTRDQAFQYPPRLVPGGDFFSNVSTLIDQGFGTMFWNTAIAAFIVVVGKTITSMLAGLAFVYFRFPFNAAYADRDHHCAAVSTHG
jgi:ABC-type glycerol-3-phosphate transport system permease component